MPEVMLGFDARDIPSAVVQLWNGERRQRFLLRLDVAAPLAVDPLVWPSLFDSGEGIGLALAERQRLHLDGLPFPDWTGPNAGLWDSLPRLRRYLAAQGRVVPQYTLVAITWLSDHDLADAGPFGPFLVQTEPSVVKPDWTLLGYDVGDGSRLSGLSNCGYGDEELPGLRSAWAGKLNHHHLFAEVADAFRFKALADARVLEHAPFFVYGLYEVGEGE